MTTLSLVLTIAAWIIAPIFGIWFAFVVADYAYRPPKRPTVVPLRSPGSPTDERPLPLIRTRHAPHGYTAAQVLGYYDRGARWHPPTYPGGLDAWDARHLQPGKPRPTFMNVHLTAEGDAWDTAPQPAPGDDRGHVLAPFTAEQQAAPGDWQTNGGVHQSTATPATPEPTEPPQ